MVGGGCDEWGGYGLDGWRIEWMDEWFGGVEDVSCWVVEVVEGE